MSVKFLSVTLAAAGTIDGKAAPFRETEWDEVCERLRITLRDLQPEAKEVFLLRQNDGLAYEEIARLRGCPVDTVKTQMRTAIRALCKALNRR